MEPIIVLPAKQVEELISRYEKATSRLIEAERELHCLKADKYVSIEWVAELWSVDTDTARKMIKALTHGPPFKADIKVLSYGRKIVRYRRSDIERITSENLVLLKDMLAQKRMNRTERIRPN